MATKKDMRRPDLVVPYVDPPEKKSDADMASTVSSTMPMAAMFTRNKMIAWASVTFSLQNWMAETPEQKKTTSSPGYLSVLMSRKLSISCHGCTRHIHASIPAADSEGWQPATRPVRGSVPLASRIYIPYDAELPTDKNGKVGGFGGEGGRVNTSKTWNKRQAYSVLHVRPVIL
ncbi:hypothetical protein FQN53_009422 [Emmonsiellopsis sp. PD_33]|nr:hypothetical protein FQN53_009422 [Emmonsiellopsis sp. PD_33]